MRSLCAAILGLEAIVIGLAVPVAINVAGHPPALAGGVWGGLAVAAVVLALLQRFGWAYYAGWALQAAFVLSGLLVPGLTLLGVVFLALWVSGVLLGRRADATTVAPAHGDTDAAGAPTDGDEPPARG